MFVATRFTATMARSVAWKHKQQVHVSANRHGSLLELADIYGLSSIVAHYELLYIQFKMTHILSANICTFKLPANCENILQLKLTFNICQWPSRHTHTVYRVHLGKSMICVHYTHTTFSIMCIAIPIGPIGLIDLIDLIGPIGPIGLCHNISEKQIV